MKWQCPECPDVLYDDDTPLCPKHFEELVPYRPQESTGDSTEFAGDENGEKSSATPSGDEPTEAPNAGTRNAGTRNVGTPNVGTPNAMPWDRSRCWHCDAVPPDPRNTECLECHRPLTPPVLLLRFQRDEIEVNPGMQVELGRVGEHSRLFRPYPNVSRWHAVVGVEPDGRPWIEPLLTPNGTFIDEIEIPALVRRPLRNGQRLRFAKHAEGTVTIYAR